MKKLTAVFCSILFATFSLSIYANIPQADKMNSDTQLLFVQTAPTATIDKQCDTKNICHTQLVLNNVAPYMLMFTEGKPRIASFIGNKDFIQQYYDKVGASEKLNTALIAFQDDKTQQHVITIKNPTYLAEKNEMVYDITFIKKTDVVADHQKLTNVAVFIDDVCAICVGP